MSPALILALLLPSLALAQAEESVVVIPLADLPRPREAPERPPERLLPGRAWLRVQPGDNSRIQLSVPLFVTEAGWVDLPLLDESVALDGASLDGRPLQLKAVGGHYRLAALLTAGSHRVELSGSVASPGAALHLSLGGLNRAPLQLTAQAPGLDFEVQDAVPAGKGSWDLPPRGALDLSWAPARPPSPRPRVVTIASHSALRVDEAGVEGSARLRYRVANGDLGELTLRLGGVQDLVATSPAIASTRIQGDRAIVILKEPLSGELEVALSWRAASPGAEGALAPIPVPEDGRVESWVSLVRGDDSVLLPEPGPGMEPVPERRLPARARGLVPGEPLVSYHIPAGQAPNLRWRRLSFSPVDAPPTLVDEASYVVVHAEHGRAWMRATWQVRNDRNPFLRVAVPEGWQVFGLRVAGRTTEPVRADDGRLLIPLEKSVETLDGLVAFPVELMLVGDEAAWDPKGSRAIATPAVNAPIAYARWELRLPAGVETREVTGRPTVVQQWTPSDQAMVIGRGTRMDADPMPAGTDHSSDGKALSQEYWNQAYSAYKANRFDEADQLLEQSLSYDSANSSAQSLLKNVDVLKGRANLDSDEELAANRVREMARARTSGVELEQANREAAYERALREGDEDKAQAEAEVLLALTEQLAAVEQTEAVDQKARLDDYRQRVSKKAESRGPDTGKSGGRAESSRSSSTTSSFATLITDEESPPEEAEAMDVDADGAYGWAAGDDAVQEAEYGDHGYFEGVEGGVEGGVVGGVLGGVMGGVLGGQVARDSSGADSSRDFGGAVGVGRGGGGRGKHKESDAAFGGGSANQNTDVLDGLIAEPSTIYTFDDANNISGELLQPQGSTAASDRKPVDPATLALESGELALILPEEREKTSEKSDKSEEAARLFATLASPEPAPAASPAPMPPAAAQAAQTEAIIVDRSVMAEELAVVTRYQRSARSEAIDDESADLGTVLTQDTLQHIPAGRSYQSVIQASAGVSAYFQQGSLQVTRPPGPPPPHRRRRRRPFPFATPSPRPPSTWTSPLDPPRRPAVAPAHPLRPPAPTATAWGLDIPAAIEASTLSLSMPETGSGLLLEQRLVPADEALELDLRYRTRRRP